MKGAPQLIAGPNLISSLSNAILATEWTIAPKRNTGREREARVTVPVAARP